MGIGDIIVLLLALFPLLASGFIVFAEKESGVSLINRFNNWISVKHSREATSSRFWSKYVVRTVLSVLKKLAEWTERIQDPFWKAGVRILAWGYASIILVFIAVMLAYMAIVIAITIAIIVLIIYVLFQMGPQTSTESRESVYFSGKGTSHERESFFGDKYTEHRDTEGNVVGRSRQRESFFGDKYVEHEDVEGNIVGKSRLRESFLGDKYTEHEDSEGNVVGESRSQENLFGDRYSEHQDSEGKVVGESRQRETFLGEKYTENKSRKP